MLQVVFMPETFENNVEKQQLVPLLIFPILRLYSCSHKFPMKLAFVSHLNWVKYLVFKFIYSSIYHRPEVAATQSA